MATTVGNAYVQIMPSMTGFSSALNSGLSKAYSSSASTSTAGGKTSATAFAAAFGAISTLVGSAVNAATNLVVESLDTAISRVDTLNNYPKVMTNLGYSAEEAAASIQTISDSLDGLPSSTDSIVSVVQALAPMCDSLSEATDLGLALNNMMLASGASTSDVSRAMTQYTQMLSKGKVDQAAWNTLVEVMPGQLNQVAQALLGATANSQSLYSALSDGTVSFDEFNAAILALNEEGLNGYASFAQQAQDATQGIGTAIDNVGNRVAKGMASIIEAIGSAEIAAAINSFSTGFKTGLEGVAAGIETAKALFSDLKAALAGIDSQTHVFTTAAGYIDFFAAAASNAAGYARDLVAGLAPVQAALDSLSVEGVASGLSAVASAFNDIMAGSTGIGTFSSAVQSIGSLDWSGIASSAASVAAEVGGAYLAFKTFSTVSTVASGAVSAVSGALGGLKIASVGAGQVTQLATAMGSAKGPMTAVKTVAAAISPALSALISPVGLVVAAVAALAAGFVYFYTTSEPFREFINSIVSIMIAQLQPALSSIMVTLSSFAASVLPPILSILQQVEPVLMLIIAAAAQLVATVVPIAAQILAAVLPVLTSIVTSFVELVSTISSVVLPIVQTTLEVFTGVMTGIQSVVVPILQAIGTAYSTVFTAIGTVVSTAMGIVSSVVSAVMATIYAVIHGDLSSIEGIWSSCWDTVTSLLQSAWDTIGSAVSSGIESMLQLVSGIPGNITSALGSLGTLLYSAGQDLLQGLMNGITAKVSSAVQSVKNAVSSIVDGAKSLLGIASPSKVFKEIGVFTIEGAVVGIEDTAAEAVKATETVFADVAAAAAGVDVSADVQYSTGRCAAASADDNRSYVINLNGVETRAGSRAQELIEALVGELVGTAEMGGY